MLAGCCAQTVTATSDEMASAMRHANATGRLMFSLGASTGLRIPASFLFTLLIYRYSPRAKRRRHLHMPGGCREALGQACRLASEHGWVRPVQAGLALSRSRLFGPGPAAGRKKSLHRSTSFQHANRRSADV